MKTYRKPKRLKEKYQNILADLEAETAALTVKTEGNDEEQIDDKQIGEKQGAEKRIGEEQIHDKQIVEKQIADRLDPDLERNEHTIRRIFQNCSDIVYRHLSLQESRVLVVYIDGLIDTQHLEEAVLKPLMYEELAQPNTLLQDLAEFMEQKWLPISEIDTVSEIMKVTKQIASGEAVFLIDGYSEAICGSLKGWSKRTIAEPQSEQVIRGPREGFIETLRINTSLLRRKIRSPKLKMEAYSLGEYTQTDIVMSYIEGIAQQDVVEEVRNRLKRIEIDGVLESGYIEGFLEDNTFALFPTVQNTERPDVVAANLLEGKVAILTDGTPFVLIVPLTFWNALNSNEDYYERFFIGTALRWIRYVFIFVALLLPSIYVSLISFQQEMIPTTLLLSVAAAQEATPFPAIVEAFGMEFMFEALREAGIRLPKPVGSAISIVGALVIGEAAVQAGIVSAPMVIVVATTGIASFTLPKYNLGIAIRLLRFPLLLLSGTFGFYGITIGVIAILIHIITLKSFGTPYFSPVAPLRVDGLKDVFVRAPWWGQNRRPATADQTNRLRVPTGQQPAPRKDPQP